MPALHRGLLWAGLGGTALLVLGGTFHVVSRVWASSLTQTLEVLVAAPFVGFWMLSPLLWVTRPGGGLGSTGDGPRGGGSPTTSTSPEVAPLVVVGVGAVAYLWAFAVRPWVMGIEPGLGSLLLVVAVPGVQWLLLGIGWLARRARR